MSQDGSISQPIWDSYIAGDRTALDRMLADAEARGYQLAADEAKRSGWHLRRYDLAKRDAELATP